MTDCGAPDCTQPPTLSWQRWATPEEVDHYHETGDLPKWETEARLMVYACDDHKISPEASARTHDATCHAPPTCDCSVTASLP